MPMMSGATHAGFVGGHPDDVPVTDAVEVVFMETPEQKELSMAAKVIKEAAAAAEKENVKVKVNEPFRVLHDGKPYVGGDVVEIPADKAKSWVQQRWVEIVKDEK
jgi:sugar phosphate isomerase/epimerase